MSLMRILMSMFEFKLLRSLGKVAIRKEWR